MHTTGPSDTVWSIVEYVENPPRLVCVGDEDRCTQDIRRRALHLARAAGGDVTVDFERLGFADTSLMVDLAMLSQRLRRRGSMLILQAASPQLMALIDQTGLHHLPGVLLSEPSTAAAL